MDGKVIYFLKMKPINITAKYKKKRIRNYTFYWMVVKDINFKRLLALYSFESGI